MALTEREDLERARRDRVATPRGERERLAEIEHYELGDPAWAEVLADVVRLARSVTGSRAAAVEVVGEDRVWPLAPLGAPAADRPRAASPSAVVVATGEPFVTTVEAGGVAPGERGSRRPGARAPWRYVGVPVETVAGHVVGALAAWGAPGAVLPAGAMDDLVALARVARSLLELHHRRSSLERDRAHQSLQSELLAGVVAGRPLAQILETLVLGVESQFAGLVCSVMLVDDGTLRVAAAPHLPEAFRDAIDGISVGSDVGSCGHAAATGEPAFSVDIASDPRWRPVREVALASGLRACWSVPVLGASGEVVATFGCYYATPRLPGEEHVRLLETWACLAGLAIARAREQESLRLAARTDPLTGLANRLAILESIEAARSGRDRRLAAVLACDLDGFKLLNDTLGHAHGDTFLVALAARLRSSLPRGVEVGRLGGDEFVVVGRLRDAASAERLAERLLETVRRPVRIAGRTVALSASVGVALGGRDGGGAHDLLKDADAAMYVAKSRGRNCFTLSDQGLREQAAAQLEMELELRSAIRSGEIGCDYQAKVDLRSGALVGVEALARWRRPKGAVVGPDVFVPLAERSGSIVELGDAVLALACEQHARRRGEDPGYRGVRLWVNVSVKQLATDLVGTVDSVLAATGLPGSSLGLEITESALVSDVRLAGEVLAGVRSRGVSVAIDDFGQGYSSLAQLRRLPVDVLKIDRAFVEGIGVDEADERIATAVIGLGRALGIDVVAEGVETELQRRRLVELGCDLGQGYLFGRPSVLSSVGPCPPLSARSGGRPPGGGPRGARTPHGARRRARPAAPGES